MFTFPHLKSEDLSTAEALPAENVTDVIRATHREATTRIIQQVLTVILGENIDDSEVRVVVVMGSSIPEIQGNVCLMYKILIG